jgi:CRISPR-associated protein Csb2
MEGDFDLSASQPPLRSVYIGRLRELERHFAAGRRPNPGAVVISRSHSTPSLPPASVFSGDWIVLADDGGRAPDLRATPLVSRKVRDALMGAYQRAVGDLPEWLSGHTADGQPSQRPHLAVVPLADVGWSHSEGRLMGCAIVLPREISPDALRPAIAELLEARSSEAFNIELHYGLDACWYLQPTESPQKASLRPARWLGMRAPDAFPDAPRAARLWTTATPLVLDRFPKKSEPEARAAEVADSITRACHNIGLPAPTHISVDANSGLRGVPRARLEREAPIWQRWQLPKALSGRYLTHATVGFDEPVQGPVIIGAGRYAGLGLCLPIDARETR